MNPFFNQLVIIVYAVIFGLQQVNGLFEDQIGKFDWYVANLCSLAQRKSPASPFDFGARERRRNNNSKVDLVRRLLVYRRRRSFISLFKQIMEWVEEKS